MKVSFIQPLGDNRIYPMGNPEFVHRNGIGSGWRYHSDAGEEKFLSSESIRPYTRVYGMEDFFRMAHPVGRFHWDGNKRIGLSIYDGIYYKETYDPDGSDTLERLEEVDAWEQFRDDLQPLEECGVLRWMLDKSIRPSVK